MSMGRQLCHGVTLRPIPSRSNGGDDTRRPGGVAVTVRADTRTAAAGREAERWATSRALSTGRLWARWSASGSPRVGRAHPSPAARLGKAAPRWDRHRAEDGPARRPGVEERRHWLASRSSAGATARRPRRPSEPPRRTATVRRAGARPHGRGERRPVAQRKEARGRRGSALTCVTERAHEPTQLGRPRRRSGGGGPDDARGSLILDRAQRGEDGEDADHRSKMLNARVKCRSRIDRLPGWCRRRGIRPPPGSAGPLPPPR